MQAWGLGTYGTVDGSNLLSCERGIPDGQLSQGAGVAPLRGVIGAPAQHDLTIDLQWFPAINRPGNAIAACSNHGARADASSDSINFMLQQYEVPTYQK